MTRRENAMSGLYGFASRLSGCMAGLCAILALLALPSRSQADSLSACQACCQSKGFVDQQLSECVGYCMQGSGPCALVGQAFICPNPISNSCPINNGNKAGCPGTACSTKNSYCGCVYNNNTNNCNCP